MRAAGDMGTSAFMLTDSAYRDRMGQLLPEGVAIDSAGRPTRNPALARHGPILPFGGYKGFGLDFHTAAAALRFRSPRSGGDARD